MPTGHILIYRKQQALPFRLLALCHLTDQAWHSVPAPWCKAGGKVAWASRPTIPAALAARRPPYDKRKAPGQFSQAPVKMILSQSWATASGSSKQSAQRDQTRQAHPQKARRRAAIGDAPSILVSDVINFKSK